MEAKTATAKRSRHDSFGYAARFLAFGGLIILLIVFSLASPYFLTSENIGGILLATAVNGILALGVTFVIINGGIDLSVGTVMTFSAVMTAQVMIVWQQPVLVGIAGRVVNRRAVRHVQRPHGHQDENTALCGDAGDVVYHQGFVARRRSIEAHLFQRCAHLQSSRRWARFWARSFRRLNRSRMWC